MSLNCLSQSRGQAHGKAEEPFLQDRVASVPHRDGETDVLVTVADAGNAVLVPAIRPGTCVVVRQVLLRIAVTAVVLADGAPGAFAEVGTPSLPVRPLLPGLFQSVIFVCHSPVRSCLSNKAEPGVIYSPGPEADTRWPALP
jgi:hypothetical protein